MHQRPSPRPVGDQLGDEDIDRSAFPASIVVEGIVCFVLAHFFQELTGALHEGLNVLCRAHGLGADGTIRTC